MNWSLSLKDESNENSTDNPIIFDNRQSYLVQLDGEGSTQLLNLI